MTPQNQYEALAKKILGELEGVVTLKLRELKDELAELREGFRTLKPKQTISDCKTWDEFCSTRLHRTKRAVNMLLADEASKSKREETSHSDLAEGADAQGHDEEAEAPDRTEELRTEASTTLYIYVQHRWLSDKNLTKEDAIQEVLDDGFPAEGFIITKKILPHQFMATDADLPSFEKEVVNA